MLFLVFLTLTMHVQIFILQIIFLALVQIFSKANLSAIYSHPISQLNVNKITGNVKLRKCNIFLNFFIVISLKWKLSWNKRIKNHSQRPNITFFIVRSLKIFRRNVKRLSIFKFTLPIGLVCPYLKSCSLKSPIHLNARPKSISFKAKPFWLTKRMFYSLISLWTICWLWQ